MICFVRIFICLVFLFNKSNGIENDILLINDPSHHYESYHIINAPNNRIKRDQSLWISPTSGKDQSACGSEIYGNLSTCAAAVDCRHWSTCLDDIHCPSGAKTIGSVIINLFRLLGMNYCYDDDRSQSCPYDKRAIILLQLLAEWNKYKDDNYCNNVIDFVNEVKKTMQEFCPSNVEEVEAFLEDYPCSTVRNQNIDATHTKRQDEMERRIFLSNANDKLTTSSSAKLSSQINYIDEDNDLNFISSNNSPSNTSEQTVYVNDHQYYNVSYIIPKTEGIPINYVENNQFNCIRELSDRHRSAFGMTLKFNFPFYGHAVNKILVATGGFIYTGDLLHSAVIGSTQYIAPFMANFDASIGKNKTEIKYFDNGTHFACTWHKIYLKDQKDAGPFTFQVILQNTGNIYFNYLQIPKVTISSANHAHRIGLSDAYMSQHSTKDHIVRVITLYDKINLDKDKISNGVSVVFEMDQLCNTFSDCTSCLANRGKRYNCSWCDDIQRCSDGVDRSREQWMRAQCHRSASEDVCPNNRESVFDSLDLPPFFSSSLPSIFDVQKRKQSSDAQSRHHSTLQTFRIILVTLLLSVLILSLVTLAVTFLYAYRNPTSPAGMWLLEHRPSNYIARFKRSTNSI